MKCEIKIIAIAMITLLLTACGGNDTKKYTQYDGEFDEYYKFLNNMKKGTTQVLKFKGFKNIEGESRPTFYLGSESELRRERTTLEDIEPNTFLVGKRVYLLYGKGTIEPSTETNFLLVHKDTIIGGYKYLWIRKTKGKENPETVKINY